VDVIGKALLQNDGVTSRTLTVVAVARDAKYRNLGEDPRGFVFVPLAQQYVPRTTIVARATHGQRLAAEMRTVVATMNPNLPIVSAQTFDDYAALGLVPQRVAAAVSGSLGVVGLLLAALGIYGVTAYLVTSRTREIGIRMALGAQRRDAVRMVLRQGMTLALGGVAIGLLCAAGAARLLGSLLFGVGATDLLAFGGAAVVFCLVGLAACYVPARRATDIDPIAALRYE
jgi:ABC-type antimicrobial peptide transport system permease subunit